jgi:hypothetical protein
MGAVAERSGDTALAEHSKVSLTTPSRDLLVMKGNI